MNDTQKLSVGGIFGGLLLVFMFYKTNPMYSLVGIGLAYGGYYLWTHQTSIK